MTDGVMTGKSQADGSRGLFMALGAYAFWSLVLFYMKAMKHVSPVEIVAHRVVWSVPFAFILLVAAGQVQSVVGAFRQPRLLAMATLTAFLVILNWSTYVWAVTHDMVMEAALGYYINPLVNALLGGLFLGERLTKVQYFAILLACIAVTVLTINAGGLPWVSLIVAFSFGFYGFFRKKLPMGALQGFTLEVLVLALPAMLYIFWLISSKQDHFVAGTSIDVTMLLLAGPITAIPLILYAGAAKLMRYTTLGLMQYLTPTVLFLCAVFVFHEPFSSVQLVAFTLIWTGLVIYTWSALAEQRRAGLAAA